MHASGAWGCRPSLDLPEAGSPPAGPFAPPHPVLSRTGAPLRHIRMKTITGSISLTYRELRAQVAYTPWFDWVLEVFGLVEVCGIGVLEFGVLTGLGGERLCGYLELGILAAI